MSPVQPLTPAERMTVRTLIVQGCQLLLSRINEVNYSEGSDRWDGIAHRKLISQGSAVFPFEGDCSSTATWLLWNGLAHHLGQPDVVNGENWNAGYTGTMASHGRLVVNDGKNGKPSDIKVGDLVLYGPPPTFEHVAVAIGGGMVFSHGSEAGPFKLPIDYRPDRAEVRRYF